MFSTPELILNLLDYIPIGACVVDRDMNVVFWNSSIENQSKIPRDEIVGVNIYKFFPNLSAPKYKRRLEEVFSGVMPVLFSSQLHKYLFPFSNPNGGVRYQDAVVSAFPITDDLVYAIICIQDVTALSLTVDNFRAMRDRALVEIEERKRTESKLKEKTNELEKQNQILTELDRTNQLLIAENIRMGTEISIATRIQKMILPKAEELKLIPDLDIASYMEPAEEVGGDYYDVLLQGTKVRITIGDVTGHGLGSGILMMMAQTAIRAIVATEETNPVEFLVAVNQTIYSNTVRMNFDKFMTLLVLEHEKNTLRISGQHEDIIIIRQDSTLEIIDTFNLGFPIGLEPDIRQYIAAIDVDLAIGDMVVLYTDGVVEAQNNNKEFYGHDRMCKIIRNNHRDEPINVCRALVEDLKVFIGSQKILDDITIVVLKQK
jgi:PAS domain S-box-containing protein